MLTFSREGPPRLATHLFYTRGSFVVSRRQVGTMQAAGPVMQLETSYTHA